MMSHSCLEMLSTSTLRVLLYFWLSRVAIGNADCFINGKPNFWRVECKLRYVEIDCVKIILWCLVLHKKCK